MFSFMTYPSIQESFGKCWPVMLFLGVSGLFKVSYEAITAPLERMEAYYQKTMQAFVESNNLEDIASCATSGKGRLCPYNPQDLFWKAHSYKGEKFCFQFRGETIEEVCRAR